MTKSASDDHDAIVKLVAKTAKATPEILFTKVQGLRLLKVPKYPEDDLVTLITVGYSDFGFSMYRGRDVGFELTLTTTSELATELGALLAASIDVSIKAKQSRERRPPIEYNGLYSPGYPPHLFFCQDLSLTPALSGQKTAGSKYVEFMAAIPISDAEMRAYDRNVTDLITQLRQSGQLTDHALRAN